MSRIILKGDTSNWDIQGTAFTAFYLKENNQHGFSVKKKSNNSLHKKTRRRSSYNLILKLRNTLLKCINTFSISLIAHIILYNYLLSSAASSFLISLITLAVLSPAI